jgi:hypothetical protein
VYGLAPPWWPETTYGHSDHCRRPLGTRSPICRSNSARRSRLAGGEVPASAAALMRRPSAGTGIRSSALSGSARVHPSRARFSLHRSAGKRPMWTSAPRRLVDRGRGSETNAFVLGPGRADESFGDGAHARPWRGPAGRHATSGSVRLLGSRPGSGAIASSPTRSYGSRPCFEVSTRQPSSRRARGSAARDTLRRIQVRATVHSAGTFTCRTCIRCVENTSAPAGARQRSRSFCWPR